MPPATVSGAVWPAKGRRPARFGLDFARNITSNFEIHGEWARFLQFPKPVTDASGHVSTDTSDVTSWLIGLRYLTESDTTLIAEYYRNGTGYDRGRARQFYQFVDAALTQFQQNGNDALVQKALSLSNGAYGRPNAGRDYLYFRAQQKDGLGVVYFQPSVTAILNLGDHSFQVTPELLYSGIRNTDLRLRIFMLQGGTGTDFGEKQNSRKVEMYVRYYF